MKICRANFANFHFGFFGIINAEIFLNFIRNCRTMKSATGTVIIFFVLIECRANFTYSWKLLFNLCSVVYVANAM